MPALQEPPTQSIDATALLTALTALKKGDFTVRLPLDWTGVAGKVADTFNEVIELNERMADELERISRVVGKEGKINQRASLGSVSGSWEEAIDLGQYPDRRPGPSDERDGARHRRGRSGRPVADHGPGDRRSAAQGRIPAHGQDHQHDGRPAQLVRLRGHPRRREVGTEGKLGGQAEVKGVAGTWKDLTDSVNSMAGNLTGQVRNIAEVTTAVANGDLSKKITVDVKGEILELKNTINTMVDQLRSFAAEVTRVAREVGTEGKLGGQAKVEGRLRHLEGPHRQRQLHGRQPDRPGPQHRRGDDRGRQRRPLAEDHRRRQGRDPRARRTPSTRWSISSAPSPPR